jgi:hypothetical protein
MVGHQTLDLGIGVRVPVSQPTLVNDTRSELWTWSLSSDLFEDRPEDD